MQPPSATPPHTTARSGAAEELAAPAKSVRKIGFNLLYLVPGKVGGTEIYARELVRAIADERPDTNFIAFCSKDAAAVLSGIGWPSNVQVRAIGLAGAAKPLRALVELFWLPLIARRDGVELLHSLGTTAPFWGRFARVVTVHDLIYHHFPQTFAAPARLALEYIVPRAAKRSHRVCADSQATKDDLVATYGIDPAKIDVVYLGLGMSQPQAVTPEPELRKQFQLADRPVVLSVAAALAHKNIDGLLRSFALLADKPGAGDPLLVIAGHTGRDQDALAQLARSLGIEGSVRFTGWIESPDLEGLYRLAACFVYPSKFEGFGMPVLEAMKRGTPVATSGATSLSEVAGDAALIFDPDNEQAIADAIQKMLDDRDFAAELVERGARQTAGFSWQQSARDTLQSYAHAIGNA